MSLEFLPLTLDLREKYETIHKNTPVKSADYTFTNLWGWADYYGISLAFINNIAIIHQKRPYHCYWTPVGDWNNFDFNIIKNLPKREYFSDSKPHPQEIPAHANLSSQNDVICMHRVPDEFVRLAKEFAHKNNMHDKIIQNEARGQWEYIYNSKDLATLSGNRYHKKKNHVNAFYKKYGNEYFEFQTVNKEKGSVEEVLSLQEEWCKWHDCEASPSLRAENDVIFRVVGSWNKIGNLIGGSLYVENQMVAFAIAEELDNNTLVVHFEKARTDFRGAYQAINHALVNHVLAKYTVDDMPKYLFVNREQDLDEEGLRKAKESYLPIDYLKKSTLVFNI